jgi:hypothetical protein
MAFFAGIDVAERLNDAGWALFDAAILWAAAPAAVKGRALLVVGDASALTPSDTKLDPLVKTLRPEEAGVRAVRGA